MNFLRRLWQKPASVTSNTCQEDYVYQTPCPVRPIKTLLKILSKDADTDIVTIPGNSLLRDDTQPYSESEESSQEMVLEDPIDENPPAPELEPETEEESCEMTEVNELMNTLQSPTAQRRQPVEVDGSEDLFSSPKHSIPVDVHNLQLDNQFISSDIRLFDQQAAQEKLSTQLGVTDAAREAAIKQDALPGDSRCNPNSTDTLPTESFHDSPRIMPVGHSVKPVAPFVCDSLDSDGSPHDPSHPTQSSELPNSNQCEQALRDSPKKKDIEGPASVDRKRKKSGEPDQDIHPTGMITYSRRRPRTTGSFCSLKPPLVKREPIDDDLTHSSSCDLIDPNLPQESLYRLPFVPPSVLKEELELRIPIELPELPDVVRKPLPRCSLVGLPVLSS